MPTLSQVVLEGAYSTIPAAGSAGRQFYATDTGQIYYDNGTSWDNVTPIIVENITLFIDGGGAPITTGQKAFTSIPYACTIQSITMLADQAGSAVVDIWKTTYASYAPGTHPVVGDSITASDKPTLSSAAKSTDSTLTGWTKTINAGDILQFVVNSASTLTKLMLVLTVERN